MANIGNIRFVERDAKYDSAAAFLLARSPKTSAVVPCGGGEVEVSQDRRMSSHASMALLMQRPLGIKAWR